MKLFTLRSVKIALSALLVFSGSVPAFQFNHPGMLNNRAELDFIKSKIAAGTNPWKDAFSRVQSSNYASLNWQPNPWANVNCGSYSNPDSGCTDESEDSKAAYTDALIWYFTGNQAFAQKSAEILDAWSGTLQKHTNSNAPLQAAWTGAMFPLAAEILRATYPAWSNAGIAQFSSMLTKAFVPVLINGMAGYNGNWELSMCDALLCIGVFNEDSVTFQKGISLWRKRIPAYFYMSTDGPTPVRPYGTISFSSDSAIALYWYHSGQYVDGLCQETCRDFQHMQMGFTGAINTAEIALHQGTDLYAEFDTRLMTAMEFHAGPLMGKPAPSWLCGGNLTSVTPQETWEIAYNHFHNVAGHALPLTDTLILKKIRPSGVSTFTAWETLTHAELGNQAGNGINAPGDFRGESRFPRLVRAAGNGIYKIEAPFPGDWILSMYSLNGALLLQKRLVGAGNGSQTVCLGGGKPGSGTFVFELRLRGGEKTFSFIGRVL